MIESLRLPEAATADAVAALRAATHDLHARLDASLPLGQPHAGLTEYLQHVRALSGWLQALSPALRASGLPHEWAARQEQRLHRLQSDLDDAGAGQLQAAKDDLASQVEVLPARIDAGDAVPYGWGAAYVIEGSQLGGVLLHRRLRERLHPHPLRYLQGDGAAGAPYWPRFLAALRGAVREPHDIAVSVCGAVFAFELLTRRFQRLGVPA